MQESNPTPQGSNPTDYDKHDSAQKSLTAPEIRPTEGGEAHKNTNTTNNEATSPQNNAPPLRSQGTHERLWGWIRDPKHSNALVAIFTILLFLTTLTYTIFAGVQMLIMRDTLKEMRSAGQATTEQTWQAIGNMNWLARSADESRRNAQQSLSTTIDESTKENKRVTDTMERQLEAAERPWLKLDVVTDGKNPIFFRDRELVISVAINTQNVGRSPAIQVHAWAELTPTETANVRFESRQRAMCDKVHDASVKLSYIEEGYTIFPNDTKVIRWQSPLILSSMKIALELENPSNHIFFVPEKQGFVVFTGDGRGFPGATPAEARRLGAVPAPGVSVIGCVDYTVEYSGLRHQTMFLYDIQGIDLRTRTINNPVFTRSGSGNLAN